MAIERTENEILTEFIEHPWFDLFYKKRIDMSMALIQRRLNSIKEPQTHEKDNVDKHLLDILNKIRARPLAALTTMWLNEDDAFREYTEYEKKTRA